MCGVSLQTGKVFWSGKTAVVLVTGNLFTGDTFPHLYEYALQLIDGRTFNPAVHIAPFTHLFGSLNIVVGYVHTARIGNFAVDDDNLAVVAAEEIIHPRKFHRVEFIDLNALLAAVLDVLAFQGLVI